MWPSHPTAGCRLAGGHRVMPFVPGTPVGRCDASGPPVRFRSPKRMASRRCAAAGSATASSRPRRSGRRRATGAAWRTSAPSTSASPASVRRACSRCGGSAAPPGPRPRRGQADERDAPRGGDRRRRQRHVRRTLHAGDALGRLAHDPPPATTRRTIERAQVSAGRGHDDRVGGVARPEPADLPLAREQRAAVVVAARSASSFESPRSARYLISLTTLESEAAVYEVSVPATIGIPARTRPGP